jgi:hypothetical protein
VIRLVKNAAQTVHCSDQGGMEKQDEYQSVRCSDQGLFFALSYEEKIGRMEIELSELCTELQRLSGRKKETRKAYPWASKKQASQTRRATVSGDESSEGKQTSTSSADLTLLLAALLGDSASDEHQLSGSGDDLSELLADSRVHGPIYASHNDCEKDDLSELLADKYQGIHDVDLSKTLGNRGKQEGERKDWRRRKSGRKEDRDRRAEEFDAVFLNNEIIIEIPAEPKPIPKKRRNPAHKKNFSLDNTLNVEPRQSSKA